MRTFGSRVDGKEKPRRPTFRVTDVIGPDRIRLSDGREITLLGISGATAGEERAVERLRELCLEKRVTIESDALVPDDESQMLRYVHLTNRKFINGHMVRSALVSPDLSRNYRHRKRFIRYAGLEAE